jgi:hypothetical protein
MRRLLVTLLGLLSNNVPRDNEVRRCGVTKRQRACECKLRGRSPWKAIKSSLLVDELIICRYVSKKMN